MLQYSTGADAINDFRFSKLIKAVDLIGGPRRYACKEISIDAERGAVIKNSLVGCRVQANSQLQYGLKSAFSKLFNL